MSNDLSNRLRRHRFCWPIDTEREPAEQRRVGFKRDSLFWGCFAHDRVTLDRASKNALHRRDPGQQSGMLSLPLGRVVFVVDDTKFRIREQGLGGQQFQARSSMGCLQNERCA